MNRLVFVSAFSLFFYLIIVKPSFISTSVWNQALELWRVISGSRMDVLTFIHEHRLKAK